MGATTQFDISESFAVGLKHIKGITMYCQFRNYQETRKEKVKLFSLARIFNVVKTTISGIKRNNDKILEFTSNWIVKMG